MPSTFAPRRGWPAAPVVIEGKLCFATCCSAPSCPRVARLASRRPLWWMVFRAGRLNGSSENVEKKAKKKGEKTKLLFSVNSECIPSYKSDSMVIIKDNKKNQRHFKWVEVVFFFNLDRQEQTWLALHEPCLPCIDICGLYVSFNSFLI